MATASTRFVLPSDYTFTPGGFLVHKDTYERVNTLVDQAKKRDPDAHAMYIYNDFFGYAVLELVDHTLSSIHTFVSKKKWLDAWSALLALVIFNPMVGGDWAHVDDGDRVIATEKAFGALLITTIRALESAEPSLLDEETIPNLEPALMNMAAWGENQEDICGVKYARVIRGYGRKLFGARTQEERTSLREDRKVAYEEFVKGLSTQERKKRGDRPPGETHDDEDEDDEDDEDGSDKPWFGNVKAKDAEINDASFRVASTWKAYKEIWSRAPHHPMRGPSTWDITKWSAADKKQFSFDDLGGFGDEF